MKPLLLGVNLLAAATLLLWPVGLFLLLFLFDAPGSETSFWTQAVAASILLYPVPVVLGNVLFWRQRKRTTPGRLGLYTLVTLCGPGLVALAFLALELFCEGRTVCT